VNLSRPAGNGLGIEGGRFNNSEEIGWHFVVRNSLSLSAFLLTGHDSTALCTRLVEWAVLKHDKLTGVLAFDGDESGFAARRAEQNSARKLKCPLPNYHLRQKP
jgi:hypothetical protein